MEESSTETAEGEATGEPADAAGEVDVDTEPSIEAVDTTPSHWHLIQTTVVTRTRIQVATLLIGNHLQVDLMLPKAVRSLQVRSRQSCICRPESSQGMLYVWVVLHPLDLSCGVERKRSSV